MKERLLYIDQLKGIAILLVVMGHFIQYNTRESTANEFFSAIYSFHMPLFMFISGYVAFKTIKNDIFQNYFLFLTKKSRALLIPFFAWPLIVDKFFFTSNPQFNLLETIQALMLDPSIGLWFLWHLFFLSVFYSVFLYLSTVFNIKSNFYFDFIIVSILFIIICIIYLTTTLGYIDAFMQYFAFFFIGSFVSKYGFLSNILLSTKWFSVFLILFILLCGQFAFDDPAFHHLNLILLLKVIISLSAIAALYYIVQKITWNNFIKKYIVLWGANSLVIYATHFKMIHLLNDRTLLPEMHLFFLVIIDMIISITIIFACMYIHSIVKLCPPLNFFLYGHTMTSKQKPTKI